MGCCALVDGDLPAGSGEGRLEFLENKHRFVRVHPVSAEEEMVRSRVVEGGFCFAGDRDLSVFHEFS